MYAHVNILRYLYMQMHLFLYMYMHTSTPTNATRSIYENQIAFIYAHTNIFKVYVHAYAFVTIYMYMHAVTHTNANIPFYTKYTKSDITPHFTILPSNTQFLSFSLHNFFLSTYNLPPPACHDQYTSGFYQTAFCLPAVLGPYLPLSHTHTIIHVHTHTRTNA